MQASVKEKSFLALNAALPMCLKFRIAERISEPRAADSPLGKHWAAPR